MADHLLVVFIGLIVDNVEKLELVDTLGSGDDAEPVSELHLLEELLGPTRRGSISLGFAPSTVPCSPRGMKFSSYRYLR